VHQTGPKKEVCHSTICYPNVRHLPSLSRCQCQLPCQKYEFFYIEPGVKVSGQYYWVNSIAGISWTGCAVHVTVHDLRDWLYRLSSLEQFKKLLKTHLFKISFYNWTVCDCKALLQRLVLPTALYKLSTLHYIACWLSLNTSQMTIFSFNNFVPYAHKHFNELWLSTACLVWDRGNPPSSFIHSLPHLLLYPLVFFTFRFSLSYLLYLFSCFFINTAFEWKDVICIFVFFCVVQKQ